MRIINSIAFLGVSLAAGISSGQALKSDSDMTLYALGYSQGQQLKSVFSLTKTEFEVLKKGMADALNGSKSAVPLETYGPKISELVKTRATEAAKVNKAEGDKYAAKIAKESKATTTDSGMVYKELKSGKGASPKEVDNVKVHYRGTLIDGTEFDSSYKRNQPTEFGLKSVIKCWTEGLQKMKVGGKARLICPSSIAYGDTGRPPTIPAGATLVFDVELLGITSPSQK
jgi:FKBP-type peptidyl-prolyl cis-trans isomerase FkpA